MNEISSPFALNASQLKNNKSKQNEINNFLRICDVTMKTENRITAA